MIDKLFIFFLVCGVSCQNAPKENALSLPPAGISREVFCELLADVQVLESSYTNFYQREDTSRKQMSSYYQQVFDRHGVTKEQFETTIQWYAAHPEEMEKVYGEVSDLLSRRQAIITNERLEPAVSDTASSGDKE